MVTKYEEFMANVIDEVCDLVEDQHPELNLNSKEAKESEIDSPAVICGVPYYNLEGQLAEKLKRFVKKCGLKRKKK